MGMVVPSIPPSAWCWIAAVVTATMVSMERYRLIERTSVLLVAGFTLTTIVSVFALQWTDYAVSPADLNGGFRFALPATGLLAVYGAFGLTGVGGDEVMQYTYWLIEKGYAAKTGRRDPNDPQWAERARQWIHTMYMDALLSMAVYTSVTAAFYVLGAAVLHARGEAPNNDQLISVLAGMYTQSLGPWAYSVFMVGAFFVMFSTLFSALAAWTRTYADAAGLLGVIEFADPASRRRAIVAFAWFFPLAWAAAFLWFKNPSWMVLVGGVGTAAILIVVMVGAVNFRYRRTAPELKPGLAYDAALWISILAISAFLAYGAWLSAGAWLQPAQTQAPSAAKP
jgi:manganese transport protein